MSYIRQLLIRQALRHKTNRPSGLIGQYKPYLNSNDSPTRDILKDYSGQGHDIQLYNFGYALQSGYGLYTCKSFTQDGSNMSGWNIINSYTINGKLVNYYNGYWMVGSKRNTIFNFTLKISGIPDNNKFFIQQYNASNYAKQELKNGINKITIDLTESTKPDYPYLQFKAEINSETEVTIEIIPDYPGALVSDGVDDYGLCENFPILTKENGYTIVAIRTWLSDHDSNKYSALLGNGVWGTDGAFTFEYYHASKNTVSFSGLTTVNEYPDLFSYQISSKYNDKQINIGERLGSDKLSLFIPSITLKSKPCSIVLYALEIYDHDLTDEEIQSVKEAMYNEYLTATNALQNHIIADYECYDKTNEDEDRNVLKDLSGNGHDITLYNFGFAEGSGYGLYAQDYTKWRSNVINSVVVKSSYNKVRIEIKEENINALVAYLSQTYYNYNTSYKIKCKSDLDDIKLTFYKAAETVAVDIVKDGITTISAQPTFIDGNVYIQNTSRKVGYIELELIPEYQGALVSDGVDDYGLCENFPILNKEDGYTVLAIRKILDYDHQKETSIPFVMFPPYDKSPFVFEYYKNNIGQVYSFGAYGGVNINPETSLSYMTSKSYNGTTIPTGEGGDYTNTLCLFTFSASSGYRCSNIAFYRAIILDKDCSTEEIKFIAKQMVAKHKEKTGETIELNF